MNDVTFTDHGTVVVFCMHTPAAWVWFARNVSAEPYQRIGNGVGVEHRYAQDIVLGLVADGLNVRQR